MANITTQTIRVDLSTDKVLPTAFTHQNDTARTLEFSMYNKGMPYTMTGNTVKFAYKSPIVDGAYTVITGSGMASGTVSGNKVTVTLPNTYTAISGVGMLTMIITPTSGTVRPVNIRLVVQKSADGDDVVMGASDFPEGLYEYMDDWLAENEPTEIANLKSDLSNITEESVNLVDFSNIIIGKNWLLGNDPARAIINIDATPSTKYYFDFTSVSPLLTASVIEKTSASSGTSLKSTGLENKTGSFTTTANTNVLCIQYGKGSIAIEESDFDELHNYVGLSDYYISAIDLVARGKSMPWQGKTMVWLGTSIPAAGKYGMPVSYPLMVGDILGATVHNEAVGSSALHCKSPERISASNPYGFLNNFEAVSRCITNSLEEMEWVIEHYNDSAVFTQNVPTSLSDADKEFIRSCSWEIKLRQKYFNSQNFPDAWIIDHGHNDIPSVASEATYTSKESISGTQHNGYYSAGDFVESTSSSYIDYDVTDELYVWISGTFGAWYDVYDIYDSDGNNIGFTRNATQTQVNALRVNVSNATTLRVSNINTQINTIGVEKLKYPTYNSLYSYNGAFDFIVNKILTYNPRARIIMIGEYENQKYPSISENQLIASQRWEFPLYKQWENLGWSQQPILVDGEYKSMLNIIIPDNLHPHTDTTGFALKTMANNIASWMNTIR